MKKSAIKKMVSLFTLLAVVISMTGISFAKETVPYPETISPRFTTIKSFYSYLDVSETGIASCDAEALSYTSYTVNVIAELQEKNGTWNTINTWSNSGEMLSSVSESCSVSTDYQHRLKATAYVYDSNGDLVESAVEYSSVV